MLRRKSTETFHFGEFEVDLGAEELRRNGKRAPLEIQPFRVLVALLKKNGALVTREELRQAVWGDDTHVAFDDGLNTAIRKIRRVLGDSATSPRFIETLPKRGYRFLAASREGEGRIQSVVVLPFGNLSGDPEQEYLSDGVTDALITSLAKIGSIRVISRTSAVSYKGSRKPLREIAAELGTEGVVEGTVQREGRRLRVTVQLVEASTDSHLWAESYDRSLESALELQSEIAATIARQIQARLSPPEMENLSRPVDDLAEAGVEAYLRGMAHVQRLTPDGLQVGLRCFRTALDADPQSALAHSGVAHALMFSIVLGMTRPHEAGPRALAAVKQALDRDPSLAQALVSLGFLEHYYNWDWPAAEAAFHAAIESSPNCAEAHLFHALLLTCLGHFDKANAEMSAALDLDPLNLLYQHVSGMQMLWQGRYEAAVVQLRGVAARAPQMQMTHLTLWTALHGLGRLDEAFVSASEAWECVGDQEMVQALEDGNRQGGYRDAMRAAADVLASRSRHAYILPHVIAHHYDYAGDTDRAFEWINQGIQQREHAMGHLNRKPYTHRLKSDPRFEALLKQLGLPR